MRPLATVLCLCGCALWLCTPQMCPRFCYSCCQVFGLRQLLGGLLILHAIQQLADYETCSH